MIILITGASHTGKTVLAQNLLEKYKYPYFSIDHLKMGLIRSGYTKFTPEDDAELEAYMWPIIREMMKTAIENKQNLVQLNTSRSYSSTPSRKSEKGLLLFSVQNEVVKRHTTHESQKGVTRNALYTQRNHDCAAQPVSRAIRFTGGNCWDTMLLI